MRRICQATRALGIQLEITVVAMPWLLHRRDTNYILITVLSYRTVTNSKATKSSKLRIGGRIDSYQIHVSKELLKDEILLHRTESSNPVDTHSSQFLRLGGPRTYDT